jgi:hypothetical protein
MSTIRPFHLAFPVKDIEATKIWYTDVLGCAVGREGADWIDFNFYGHQISAHLCKNNQNTISKNIVDGKDIPTRHFGAILDWNVWETLSRKFYYMNVDFIVKPYIRFKGEPGEQGTMFIKDPSGNYLEFKSFKDDSMIFEKKL